VAAGFDVKNKGLDNNLLERLAKDERVPFTAGELDQLVGDYQQFTGRAGRQTMEFLDEQVEPVLEKYQSLLGDVDATITV
jgi:adenylosuccinate lyase